MRKPLALICRKKTKFILHIFLEILQRHYKPVLSTLGMPDLTSPKWYYQLVKNFRVYLQAKNNFISHALLEILQRYANFLIWVLWTCLIANTQNDRINLCKTLMFICMQKTNFSIHFILEILHFKKSGIWLAVPNWGLEFWQIWEWWWNINNNISFHFRLFLWKTKDNFFKKNPKITYFWAILGPFNPN